VRPPGVRKATFPTPRQGRHGMKAAPGVMTTGRG